MTNAEIIYKPGDWLLHRFIFNYAGKECTYLFRITVKNIRETTVFYSVSLEKIEKWDDTLICGFYNPAYIAGNHTSDISQATPESRNVFINPAYTGEYKISKTTTLRYYKGILTYLENTEPGVSFTRIQLIDTSIQELKASITPLGMSITMIGLILVVLATIITVIAIFIVVRRRHKTTETPLNQSQGA
ncbi:MAG: hypothetical protein GU356_00820 [Pyrobaculum sp.]|nr:hypothetical protein [Pyrobaculum sp.]